MTSKKKARRLTVGSIASNLRLQETRIGNALEAAGVLMVFYVSPVVTWGFPPLVRLWLIAVTGFWLLAFSRIAGKGKST